jgi:hypothetical protein
MDVLLCVWARIMWARIIIFVDSEELEDLDPFHYSPVDVDRGVLSCCP